MVGLCAHRRTVALLAFFFNFSSRGEAPEGTDCADLSRDRQGALTAVAALRFLVLCERDANSWSANCSGKEGEMRELDHVDSFLLQVDTRGTFLKIAELLSDAAAQDTEARQRLSAIRVWTQKQIDVLAQQAPRTGITGNILGTPAEESVLAVAYLRVKAALHANVPAQLPELKKVLADTTKVLDSLEPDFITGLLMETEKRASRDPLFANNLNQAKEDLRWLGGQLIYLPILVAYELSVCTR
jgi:hypothetical protein